MFFYMRCVIRKTGTSNKKYSIVFLEGKPDVHAHRQPAGYPPASRKTSPIRAGQSIGLFHLEKKNCTTIVYHILPRMYPVYIRQENHYYQPLPSILRSVLRPSVRPSNPQIARICFWSCFKKKYDNIFDRYWHTQTIKDASIRHGRQNIYKLAA